MGAVVMTSQVFLLSPAYCAGRRARILLRPDSEVPLAVRLRDGVLTLGETFSFLSGLYFRGKLAYASQFARPAQGEPGTLIITPTRGLLRPETLVSPELIREFAGVDISEHDERYLVPLNRDVSALAAAVPARTRVVLLGSVATGKYVDLLARRLGARLHYPLSFIGRGDMSRGGLLLRSARASIELDYAVLDLTATRRGPRPPKLGPDRPVQPVVAIRVGSRARRP